MDQNTHIRKFIQDERYRPIDCDPVMLDGVIEGVTGSFYLTAIRVPTGADANIEIVFENNGSSVTASFAQAGEILTRNRLPMDHPLASFLTGMKSAGMAP